MARFGRRAVMAMGAAAVLAATPVFAKPQYAIVATTGMIADAARVIGGDLVAVKGLMGPGVDPHAYRQTRSDIVAMTRADLVLWNGLFLEAQMESFLLDLGKRRRVVAIGEAVPADMLLSHDVYEGRHDPHLWMDPGTWRYAVSAIARALVDMAPEHAGVFAANAESYLDELGRLQSYTKAALATVPVETRVLVTAHDAFNYFGAAYGFEVLGIQGISTESEAGLARISSLVDVLVERGIEAVFVESSVSDRNVRALIEGAAARGHTVRIGGELYSDAMGDVGTYEGTWIGMIDHNATVIARALGGDVAASGMDGRLTAGT